MRDRRTVEDMRPIIYKRNPFGRYFNDQGEDVTGMMLSSFPWRGDEDGEFEWRLGWTRLRHFYVDDMLTREQAADVINARFFHAQVV